MSSPPSSRLICHQSWISVSSRNVLLTFLIVSEVDRCICATFIEGSVTDGNIINAIRYVVRVSFVDMVFNFSHWHSMWNEFVLPPFHKVSGILNRLHAKVVIYLGYAYVLCSLSWSAETIHAASLPAAFRSSTQPRYVHFVFACQYLLISGLISGLHVLRFWDLYVTF